MQSRATMLYTEIMQHRLVILELMKGIHTGEKPSGHLQSYAPMRDWNLFGMNQQSLTDQDALSWLDTISTALHRLEDTITPTHTGAAMNLSERDIRALDSTRATQGLVGRVALYYRDFLSEMELVSPHRKNSIFKQEKDKSVEIDNAELLAVARSGFGC